MEERFEGLISYSNPKEGLSEELEYRLDVIKLMDKDTESFKKLSLQEQDKIFDGYLDELLDNKELRKKIDDYFLQKV